MFLDLDRSQSIITWNIPKLEKNEYCELLVTVNLSSSNTISLVKQNELLKSIKFINIDFNIISQTLSGLDIRSLKLQNRISGNFVHPDESFGVTEIISNTNNHSQQETMQYRWIRNITKANNYICRLNLVK